MHKNKVSGRVYIGQTTQEPTKRFGKDGTNYKNQKLFYRDIVKFGWSNFDHYILEEVTDKSKDSLKDKLNNKETNYILKFESIIVTKGYNTALYSDNIRTNLTTKAKRMLNYYMAKGYSLIDAYDLYRSRQQSVVNKTNRRRNY